MGETLETIEESAPYDSAFDNDEWMGNSIPRYEEDDMSEDHDASDLFQALLEIRVRLDVFEDLLAQELHAINAILEDGIDVPSRAAYTRIHNLIRALESDDE